jgi:hypothetical protein
MEAPAIQRDLGRHDAQIEALERDVKRMREDMHEMREQMAEMHKEFGKQLQSINETLSEARGGWRTLMLVGGVSATIGAAGYKMASLLNWFPR